MYLRDLDRSVQEAFAEPIACNASFYGTGPSMCPVRMSPLSITTSQYNGGAMDMR